MNEVATLLNDMMTDGVIADYAVFGAVAQMRYTEAIVTLDADVLVAVPDQQSLDLLGPIYTFCRQKGYEPEGEAIRVGDWPVQFIPAFNPLTEEAMKNAEEGNVDGVPLRVVSATYLAVIALSAGRAKDLARIVALREAGACKDEDIAELSARHNLADKWNRFQERFRED